MPQLFDYALAALKYVAGILGPSSGYIFLAILTTCVLEFTCAKRGLRSTEEKQKPSGKPRSRIAAILEKSVIYCLIIILSRGFDTIVGLHNGIQRASMSALMLEEAMSIITCLSLLGYSRLTRWLEALYVRHVYSEVKMATREATSDIVPTEDTFNQLFDDIL